MEQQNEPLIRMHFLSDNPVLTVDQFDQLDREVKRRAMLGDVGIGDAILWQLLEDYRGRANECRIIMTTRSKRKALADHLLLELDDRIFRHNDTDIYQAHEAMWKITGDGPYKFELLKDN
tara:strand:- start:2274 stop:2633 length:360 start_codon:yes stop_codon:yes gene_type:complete